MTMGVYKTYSPRGNDVREITVVSSPEKIAAGEALAAFACAGCHSLDKTLPLSGGEDILADIPMPMGHATPPNLTPAGNLPSYTDGEIRRIIREGTSPDGHLSPLMSSMNFRVLSQYDLDSLVAYLRSQPAVPNDAEFEQSLSPLAMVFLALGFFPVKEQPESNEPPPLVAKGATAAYGGYIGEMIDCALCHGDGLVGGTSNLAPRGPDLITVSFWSSSEFVNTIRTGMKPNGDELDPEEMPWETLGKLDDETLTGV
jgi:mono/diheme cytochrome c family protein